MSRFLIIVGAGASANAFDPSLDENTKRFVPPVTKDIFTHRIMKAILSHETTALNSSMPQINHRIKKGESVEDILTSYQKLADGGNDVRKRSMNGDLRWSLARLFCECSRGLKLQPSQYDALLLMLNDARHEFLAVSFNYDTLLEQAATRVHSHEYATLDDYIKAPVPILKPHGSWNWIRSDHGSIAIQQSDMLTRAKAATQRLDVVIGPPIRSIKGWECPDTHLDALKEFISEPYNILVIGWRGDEPHFFETLSSVKTFEIQNLIIVSKTEETANKLIEKFSAYAVVKSHKYFTNGFQYFMENEIEHAHV